MNVDKTKSLVSDPGPIQLGMSLPAFLHRTTGEGGNSRLRRAKKVTCEICGHDFRQTLLTRHMQAIHHVDLTP
jgi:hypothetical protein